MDVCVEEPLQVDATPSSASGACLHPLFEQAEIAKFNKQDQKLYEDSMNAYRDIVNAIRTAEKKKYAEGEAEGLAKGLVEGRAEGRAEGIVEVAKKMLDKGMAAALVAEMTGLPLDKVSNLKQ